MCSALRYHGSQGARVDNAPEPTIQRPTNAPIQEKKGVDLRFCLVLLLNGPRSRRRARHAPWGRQVGPVLTPN